MVELVDTSRMSPEQALSALESAHREERLAQAKGALALLRLVKTYRHPFKGDKSRLGGEGTPEVDDFVCLEAAAVLRWSPPAVSQRAADLLDLECRHPRLWEQVVAGGVPVWQACKIASACRRLSKAKALWVDATVAPFTARLGSCRLLRFVEGLVVQADPVAADAAAESAKRRRRVSIGGSDDGVSEVYGVVDAADGVFLEAALAQLADILKAEGSADGADGRRASALGILATPARALAMIQRAAQPVFGLADPAEAARESFRREWEEGCGPAAGRTARRLRAVGGGSRPGRVRRAHLRGGDGRTAPVVAEVDAGGARVGSDAAGRG